MLKMEPSLDSVLALSPSILIRGMRWGKCRGQTPSPKFSWSECIRPKPHARPNRLVIKITVSGPASPTEWMWGD